MNLINATRIKMLEILTNYFKLIKFFKNILFKSNNYFTKQFERNLTIFTTFFLQLKDFRVANYSRIFLNLINVNFISSLFSLINCFFVMIRTNTR